MKSNLFIFEHSTIRESLKKIKLNGLRTLVVLDKKRNLIGTLSDGDIRKQLLKGKTLNSSINNCINIKPIFYTSKKLNKKKIIKIFRSKQIGLVPVIKDYKDRKVIKILSPDNLKFVKKKIYKKSNYKVVIIAGGKGTRLKPFTNILPKPLMPLGEKTLIELIIEKFLKFKIDSFQMVINYKSNLIKSFFENTKKLFKINFTEERTPLGTVGGLKSIKSNLGKNFFVINCDTIFNLNFLEMMKYHEKNNNILTIATSKKTYQFPYGYCNVGKDRTLNSISEKPKFRFLVNTGLYVANNQILKLLVKNKKIDMNELIEKCLEKKIKIGTYPIKKNNWIDVGQLDDFTKEYKKIK